MGRLGFNLVRHKDPIKTVEDGPPSTQQNEKNESAELNELVIAVGNERRRYRKNLPGLIVFITMIIFYSAYIAIRLRPFQQGSAFDSNTNDSKLTDLPQMQLLQDQKDETTKCWQQLSEYVALVKWHDDLKHEIAWQVSDGKNETEQLTATNEHLQALRARYMSLETESQRNEKILRAELKKLREDREELRKKVAKGEEMVMKLTNSELESSHETTTKPTLSLFNSAPFKKMNDIVKRIETVGRIFGNVIKDGI
ncbi:PREDICTED: uncharacterized protein LOC105360834 [Ceratosolen solmsi marchali]|uniref:Uncharacterized protein LOC105360834 n=1 Tax=Ceratosolen solmsi marchali TaxID=326594 RepID=A0AAJ6YDN2_9HYME|nr:PREDICTED: uncharacterized protein LOC105360834 [Ceratosolen solmsi marchali]